MCSCSCDLNAVNKLAEVDFKELIINIVKSAVLEFSK
jgi:hypothetical protein